MKKLIKIVVIYLMCFVGNAFANSADFKFILGASFSQLSNTQYISPTVGLINSYITTEQTHARTFYGFGAAYNVEHIIAQPITFGLGLSLYHFGLGDIAGIETPGVNIIPSPQDALTYKIQTKNLALFVEPKLAYSALDLQPYVFGGLGYAKNTLRHFTEGSLPDSAAARAASPYPSHTQTRLAYEAGCGLQYVVWGAQNKHAIMLHMEYRYFNLGQSRLGSATAQTTDQHIIAHITTQVADLGITYRF